MNKYQQEAVAIYCGNSILWTIKSKQTRMATYTSKFADILETISLPKCLQVQAMVSTYLFNTIL